ncbi:chromosomal replication initiator DnaA [Rhizobium sp. CRIBSB]|nr:chromosomal replication initiator DnaA [Rhizobium sp. CRIBSB]
MATPSANQMRLPLQRDLPADEAGFVMSDSNRAAATLLQAWPDGSAAVLAICGPEGSGKSHLARLWAERVGALPLDGSEASQIDPMELEGRPVLLDRAQDADDETLFHLFNLVQAPGGALLMTSRAAPVAWKVALPDLRSRLDAVVTVAMEAPDDAVLAAILRARFGERSITAPPDAIDYLVRRIDRSAAAAAAVVDRLDALHRPVTRALARQVLDESAELFD